ncbi:MAG: translation initiation factor IF-2 [Pirellulales bacterium]
MPVRIYSLAKELQVDSKQLVEICNRAGVTGKGSALASLSDEEAEKVKSFIAGGGKKQAKKKSVTDLKGPSGDEPVRPERPEKKAPKEMKTLRSSSGPLAERLRSKAAEAEEAVVEAKQEEVVVEPGDLVEAESQETPVSPEVKSPVETAAPTAEIPDSVEEETVEVEEPSSPLGAFRRDQYISPNAKSGKMRVLGKRKSTPTEGAKPADKPKAVKPKRSTPVVKLAKMPKVAQPKAKEKTASGPAPQKPIMQLPKDAIKGAKAGQKAPLEEFTKQHEKKGKKGKKNAKLGTGEQVSEQEAGKGKGKTGVAGMAGGREARTQGRNKRRGGSGYQNFDGGDRQRRRPRRHTRKGTNTAAPRKTEVALELPCSMREFCAATGISNALVQKTLLQVTGALVTINSSIDTETAEMLAAEFEVKITLKDAQSVEDTVMTELDAIQDDPDKLTTRPPVVTFLGHVDHGKTSLLDKIIGLDVVSGEAGGITQHIRAYLVDKGDGKKISFVDTPGHEAFTEMRARGANVTDIAVLIVAADDGVMPQTEEAISHARAANVPIIVALNKIDVPGANPEQALQQLSQHGLLPTEWGGDVEVVKTSAMTGEGVDDLLETILLTAEIHEYQADPTRNAAGVCLEAEQESDRGVMTKVIIQTGTLKVGDIVVCGTSHGRVKAIYDTLSKNKRLKVALPSTPVNITGLDKAPEAGEKFHVLESIAKAREVALLRANRTREENLSGHQVKVSLEIFQERLLTGSLIGNEGVSTLNIILRADTRGSIEALQKELEKLEHPEVKVKLLQTSVGGVTVADVTLASASDAVIVGFNVIPDEAARALADEKGVEIRRYDIIYKVTDDIRLLLEGKLKPEQRVKELGRALVQRVFHVSRLGSIAGCRVLGGAIERGCRIRLNRDGRGIGEYPLDSLKREKDDAKEVREGYECGIKLSGFNDIKEGDILEAFRVEEIARTLDV